jgi:hypothetical protein
MEEVEHVTTDAEIDGLRRELAELRLHHELWQVYVRYAWLMDSGQHEAAVTEIFTEDAELSLGADQPSSVGRAAQLERLSRVDGILEGTAHFVTNLHAVLNDDGTASTRVYVQSYNWAHASSGERLRTVDFVGIGVYLDDLRHSPEGWRIYRRRRRNLGPSPLGHGSMPPAMSAMLPAWGGDRDR